MPIQKIRANLENNHNWASSILNVVLIPFLIFDGIIALCVLLGMGFSVIPTIINVMIYVPLTLIVTFEYIIPIIRGN